MKSIRFRRLGSLPFGGIPHAVLAAAFVAIYLFPIYWMFISGLKSSSEIFANPPTFVPRQPTLAAFEYVFVRENVLRYLRNSLTIAIPVTLLTLLMGSMGAYAMSRLRGRPGGCSARPRSAAAGLSRGAARNADVHHLQVARHPEHVPCRHSGDDVEALSFALVILRPMFRQVPIELEVVSFVDGCTLQTFRLIVLPIMRVPLIVVGTLSFVQAYGQFVYAMTLLSQQELQPATVGIYSFVGAEYADWHRVMAFCRFSSCRS